MLNTLNNLQQLAELYKGNIEQTNEALVQAVETYQVNHAPEILSFVYCRIYGVTTNVAKKFSYMDNDEKASLSTQALHEAMLNYDLESKQSVQYYFSIVYRNILLNETRSQQMDMRKANEQTEEFDVVTMAQHGEKEDKLEAIDLVETLENLGLNKTELAYCKEVVNYNSEIKNVDIAVKLGISGSAIKQMKQSLKRKLKETNILGGI